MPKRTRGLGPCSVHGCERLNLTGGLCSRHYAKMRLYGTTDGAEVRGDKRRRETLSRTHPLYSVWFIKKSNGILSPEWLDFQTFVVGIGPKPGKDFTLCRLDQSEPFGPGNVEWRPHLKRQPGESNRAWWARKWAHRRLTHPEAERSRHLKRKYGMSNEEYAAMLADQNGLCAICQKPETSFCNQTGSVKRFAVDHCHASNKVRGLLCFRCNGTIGKVSDDVTLLDAMRAYLVHHAPGEPSPAVL